ncbi:hypothetical protein [Rhizorhabdus dicambivorans]|uniref:SCP2 domain-containing protein n=1 Tax=Rhizorhabdus dicambivorans TaxID=1850238 RepID=A0A2A4FQ07_9SPHN|nr:hypothetical protein [Rhizorhabdus dicambivorans]ATE64674.1 hypothetical protein CMV14_09870 [Rhizorhabdus dicambivorans]PCE39792.1 hypothetical protein COO09_23600 [Rhizorhabdus dicambivorans]
MARVDSKLVQGSEAWFDMVGTVMSDAAARAGLPADLNISLVERYTDGSLLLNGLIQGLRFEIVAGKPRFRIGAGPTERGDILIEITSAAARELNLLHAADPAYHAALGRFIESGEMRIDGDPARLGDWLGSVHDPIVDRTR